MFSLPDWKAEEGVALDRQGLWAESLKVQPSSQEERSDDA